MVFRLLFLSALSLILPSLCRAEDIAEVKIDGPFQPNVESLSKYQCPEWFRDAKFGIYVHWGVYSVPERGEWYGREMYQEGSSVYQHHVATWAIRQNSAITISFPCGRRRSSIRMRG